MSEAVGSSNSPRLPTGAGIIRFGNFEVDSRSGELRRGGIRVKLSGQPFDVLVALLEKPGQVVTREELHDKLWAQDTFVDFEHGLNKAINKVRDALGDDADNPRFVETLPRRGYRFLAPVVAPVVVEAANVQNSTVPITQEKQAVSLPLFPSGQTGKPRRRGALWVIFGAVTILVVAVAVIVASVPARPPRVLRYTQLTHDGLSKFTPLVTDGSRIYFREQDVQKHNIIAQVSVSGGQVSTVATSPGDPISVFDYSPARSELLVGFFDSPLWALSLPDGSTRRRVGNIVTDDAVWSDDGQSVLYSAANGLNIMKADGSDARKIAAVPGIPGFISISPDGKTYGFTLIGSDDQPRNKTSLWELGVDGSNLRPLFPNWRERNNYAGSWTHDGKYLIFGSSPGPGVGGPILAMREKKQWFERRTLEPVELTAGPLSFEVPILSKDGKQIFVGGRLDRGELLRYNAKTHSWDSYLPGISAVDLDFSQDGQWVTYVLVPEGTLWRSRVDGSERLQLTIPPLRTAMPRWSPDGKTIAFMALKPGKLWTIYSIAADGGNAEQLFTDNKYYVDPNWSTDGRRLVYSEWGFEPKAIHILDLHSHSISDLPGSDGFFSPRWSPDGQFILAQTWAKLMRFDLARQKWAELCEAGSINYPNFSRNGKYIFFSDSEGTFFSRLEVASGKIERVANVNPPLSMKMDDIWLWTGLAPDDSPMFLRDTSTAEIYALDVDFP